MKKIILVLLITFTTLLADFVMKEDGTLTLKTGIQETVPTETASYTVVPGLYGFGTDTRAAYGGTVDPIILHVDTLVSGVSNTDSTHGSFEWAVTQKFPRIVVFDVSGIIENRNADNNSYIAIDSPYLTIAGQTAPDSIILNSGGIRIRTHDVLIQHIAVRNKPEANLLDCILGESSQRDVYNVVLDHVSVSWGADEQIDFWTNTSSGFTVHDITVANTLIGIGIEGHSRGSMAYGQNIGWVRNLYDTHDIRNPMLKSPSSGVAYNNLIYNWKNGVMLADYEFGGTVTIGIAGNHAVNGNYTNNEPNISNHLLELNRNNYKASDTANVYMSDNIKHSDVAVSGYDVYEPNGHGYNQVSEIDANGYVVTAASLTKASVLASSGARPNDRDTVDTEIISRINAGLGEPSAPLAVAPTHPTETSTTEAFVPVANANDMYDSNYTNLEHQLHQLAAAVEK